jgi:hypothetical protein
MLDIARSFRRADFPPTLPETYTPELSYSIDMRTTVDNQVLLARPDLPPDAPAATYTVEPMPFNTGGFGTPVFGGGAYGQIYFAGVPANAPA